MIFIFLFFFFCFSRTVAGSRATMARLVLISTLLIFLVRIEFAECSWFTEMLRRYSQTIPCCGNLRCLTTEHCLRYRTHCKCGHAEALMLAQAPTVYHDLDTADRTDAEEGSGKTGTVMVSDDDDVTSNSPDTEQTSNSVGETHGNNKETVNADNGKELIKVSTALLFCSFVMFCVSMT